MTTSVLTADAWLHDTLTKDTTLAGLVGSRIFVDSAPKATAFPFLVYQFITGRPVKGVGKVVMFYEETWQVRAVIDEGSYKEIGTIINRVRTLTDGVEGTGVLSCEEVQTFRFSEYDQGTEYCALGVELLVRTQ